MGIAADLAIIVVAALVGGMIAQLLRQPLIVGYILAGVIVGPYTAGVTVGSREEIALLAEIGVALLLFTLGIEFSLKDLRPVRRVAIFGTPIQVLLGIGLGYGVGQMLGLDWLASLWFGVALGPSNTMIVLKTLGGRGLLGTLSSRVMIGMLIVQDLCVMAIMLVLPYLGGSSFDGGALLFAIVRAALFLGVMLLIGTRVIPWLMRRIARWESRELFLITVTALGLGIGYAAWLAGLSFAFGAFLAGLVISESDYSHQALGEVIPLRDIFAMLFFVSVGMLLDPAFLVANLGTVLWVVAIVAVAKMFIFGGITRAFGYRNVIPLASALALFQLGEFSFVLARQGLTSGVFSADTYSLILTVALVTILMTPPAFQLTQPLYRVQRRLFRSAPLRTFDVPADGLEGHVVVAGAGRVGQFVAGMLHRLHVPVVAIELNQQRVDECKQQGIPVIYGDAAHPVVLKAAAVARAHLALVTTPAMKTTQSIAQQIRTLNPELHIVARAEAIEQLEVLHDIGVYEVVQPEFEAGLEIARQALLHLDLPAPEVQRYTDAVRQDLYAPIYQMHSEYAEVHALEQARRLLEFTWVTLPEGSPLAGCSLGEAQIRSHTGATVVAIMRRGALVSNPGTAEILRAGDVLAVLGNHGELEGFTALARPASGAGDV